MSNSKNLPLSAFMPHHPSSDPHAPFTAKAGKKNNICARKIELSEVIKCIETIYDPEIPVNIYELGLIYKIEVDEKNKVLIEMTLTSPNCPVAESLPNSVKENILKIEGIEDVNLKLVWDPPWTKDKMSEAAKLELNL